MDYYLTYVFWGNEVQYWLFALLIVIAGFTLIKLFKKSIITRLKKWTERTQTTLDDFLVATVESSIVPLFYIGSIYIAISILVLPPKVMQALHVALLVVITYYIIRTITRVFKELIHAYIKRRDNSDIKVGQARGLLIIINIVIWIIGVVFLIDNLGYDVTTLVAGLGIGGIAIALAAQAILGDLFSYFVIFFDRPFEIGDFIIIDDKMGIVEQIGIKTTRLRTLSGEQLVCSNTYLTNAQVHNYKRMEKRRVVFSVGILYETPVEKVAAVPDMVKKIISSKENVQLDRGHFSGFGDSSLNYEFVYYVLSSEYNVYMDIQQSIFLDIVKAFEAEEIEFAYPTRMVHINNLNTITEALKPAEKSGDPKTNITPPPKTE